MSTDVTAADYLPLTEATARRFVDRFSAPVLSQLARFRLPADLAEDAAQEALHRALRALPRFRGDSALSTWVYRIAHREGLRALERWQRRRAREAPISALGEPQAETAPDLVAQEDELQRLRRALDTLPDNHRLALGYHYLEGLSVAEIAQVTGAAQGTVKAWLKRGRDRLRERFANGKKDD